MKIYENLCKYAKSSINKKANKKQHKNNKIKKVNNYFKKCDLHHNIKKIY